MNFRMDTQGFSVLPVEAIRPDIEPASSTESSPFFLPKKTELFANEVHRIAKPLLKSGNNIQKVVSCQEFYSAILLDSGALVLFCPELPYIHGQVIDSNGESVRDVAAGETHFVFCTESGAVYTMGYSNMYGQLGDGSIWRRRPAPTPPASSPSVWVEEHLTTQGNRFSATEAKEGLSLSSKVEEGGNAEGQKGSPMAHVGPLHCIPPLSSPRRICGFGDVEEKRGDGVLDRESLPKNHIEKVQNQTLSTEDEAWQVGLREKSRDGKSDEGSGNAGQLTSSKGVGGFQTSALEGEKRYAKGDLPYSLPFSPSSALQEGVMMGKEDESEAGSSAPSLRCPSSFRYLGPKKEAVRICAVSCGVHHTLLLTSKHHAVYACGRGHLGQLGGARSVAVQASFRSIRLLFGLPIQCIAAAGHHSFVVLSTGRLLGFGDNRSGQLGVGHCCREVPTPTAASFLVEEGSSPPNGASFLPSSGGRVAVGGEPASSKRLKDAKMFSSLRAAYGSYESTYYPMRVQRINTERRPHEPFVVNIWTSECVTVIFTADLRWMSCGLPISRSAALSSTSRYPSWQEKKKSRKSNRFDGFGTLGRPLFSIEESFSFGVMAFSGAVAECLTARGLIFPSPGRGSRRASSGVTMSSALFFGSTAHQRVECFCYPHVVVVKIPPVQRADPLSGNKLSLHDEGEKAIVSLFVQSSVVEGLIKFKPESVLFSEGKNRVEEKKGSPAGGRPSPFDVFSPSSSSLSPLLIRSMRPTTSSPREQDYDVDKKNVLATLPLHFRAAEICPPDYSPAKDTFVLQCAATTTTYAAEVEKGKPRESPVNAQGLHDALVFRLPSSITVLPFSSCCILI